MSANVGTFDRLARIVVGLALIAFALGYLGWLDRRAADPDRSVQHLSGL